MPPRFAFDYLTGNTRAVITGAPFDDSDAVSPLLADFTAKVNALEIDDEARADLIARGTAALTDVVGPAYERLIAMFERHEQMTDDRDGAWKTAARRSLLRKPARRLHNFARPVTAGSA